jgi:aminoglycoside phosphotransferase (APT) family kinase protein
MHGDLTPWNLRQRTDGTLFLIDWEDAGWAPPGADEVYYWATEGFLSGGEMLLEPAEAREYWIKVLDGRLRVARASRDTDIELVTRLLVGLRSPSL